MKKIVFICPYFGTLPKSHINLWLKSCEMNPTIDWIIFTDDRSKYNYPSNVYVNYTTLEKIKSIFQKKFDFPIFLDNAYKLCDYKPAYGFLFSSYIKKYDFWGYCDMSDCIFGNIRKFITDDLLRKNEKIGFLGHLTLYKNSREVNERFMLNAGSNITYKEVFSSSKNMAFDELNPYSINSIYQYNNIPFCRIDEFYYDVSPLYFPFIRSCYNKEYKHFNLKKTPTVFKWDNGSLYGFFLHNSNITKDEFLYIHFQKRKMINELSKANNCFYIFPNKFSSNFNLHSISMIKKVSRFRFYPIFFKFKYKAFKYKLRKLLFK